MYSGRYEVVLPVKIYFVKIGAVLSDILASQKCIKWGWYIIRGWMTVPRRVPSRASNSRSRDGVDD